MFYVDLASILFLPAILLLFGWMMASRHDSVGSPNAIFGYRTKASMHNQDTWEFANRYWGRLCLKWGIPLAIASIAALCLFGQYEESLIVIILLQLIPLFITIFLTEHALKKNFDETGKRYHV